MGYRQLLFDAYHLPEAALATETCALIAHHLPRNFFLTPEVRYVEFLPKSAHSSLPSTRIRADLAVFRKRRGWPEPRPSAVIEVKRAAAPRGLINDDLRRLAFLKLHRPRLRCFLFLFSEGARPTRFVKTGGGSIRGKQPIIDCPTSHFRVRRSCKAAPAFSNKDTAHYACLLEVFNGAAA